MPQKLTAVNPDTGEQVSFEWNGPGSPTDTDLDAIYAEYKNKTKPRGASGSWDAPSISERVAQTLAPVSDQSIMGYLDKASKAVSRAGEFYAGGINMPGVDPRYDMMQQAINKPDEQLESPGTMLADALIPKGTYEGKGAANLARGMAHGAGRVLGGFADPQQVVAAPLLAALPARVVQVGMALVAAGEVKQAYDLLQAQGLTGEVADKAMSALAAGGMAYLAGPKKAAEVPGKAPIEPEVLPPETQAPRPGIEKPQPVIDITPTSAETIRKAPPGNGLPPPPMQIAERSEPTQSFELTPQMVEEMLAKNYSGKPMSVEDQQLADSIIGWGSPRGYRPTTPEGEMLPTQEEMAPPPGTRASGTNPRALGTNPRSVRQADQETLNTLNFLSEKRDLTKGEAMQKAALERKLSGNLTAKERQTELKRAESNFIGKPVQTPDGPGVVKNMAFGRVRVALESGKVVGYAPEQVTPKEGYLQTSLQQRGIGENAVMQGPPKPPVGGGGIPPGGDPSERGFFVADLAIQAAKGFNELGKGLGKFYRAGLAGGIRTAQSNAIQGLGRFGLSAIADAMGAVATAPFSTRLAKTFGTRAADRVKGMLDVGTILQDAVNSALVATGKEMPQTRRAAETKALQGLTSTFAPGELNQRMWHYFGGAINVPGQGQKPLSAADKITRLEVAPNIIQDRVIRMMVMDQELAPLMRETGSVSYTDLAQKALQDPVLEAKLKDSLDHAMTEALSVTAGLPPMSGALKEFTKAVHQFGWSWMVDPFFDYALHQAPQQFLESAPILNLLSKRTRESLNLPELQTKLQDATVEKARLEAEVTKAKARVSHASGMARAAAKTQQIAAEQQLREHNEKVFAPLKEQHGTGRQEGRFSGVQMAEHATLFALMAGLFYAIRNAKGEDGTEFHQKKDEKTGKMTSALSSLGPYAFWGLVGDAVAREQMKSDFYNNRKVYPFVREFLVGVGHNRFPDAPSVEKYLDSLMADDTTPPDTREGALNAWAASVGRAFGKLGLYGDAVRFALNGKETQGNPGVLLPGDKPFTSAFARGFMNEQPEALRHGLPVPPKYDSASGLKEQKEESYAPFPSNVKMDSKVAEFLRKHQSEISPKDVFFKDTGIEWYDKAANDFLAEAIRTRVEPLIDDKEMDDATKVEAVKATMARVRDAAHVVAKKQALENDLPLPPRIARQAAEAAEREDLRRGHPEVFHKRRTPADERMLKGEKRDFMEKAKKQQAGQ